MITYGATDILGLGFLIGFILIAVSYFLAFRYKKEVPKIRKSIFYFLAFFVLFATPSSNTIYSKLWVLLSLGVAALILNNIFHTFVTIYTRSSNKKISDDIVSKITQAIFLFSILISVVLLVSGSVKVIAFTNYFAKQLILFMFGLIIALKLFYNGPSNCDSINNK